MTAATAAMLCALTIWSVIMVLAFVVAGRRRMRIIGVKSVRKAFRGCVMQMFTADAMIVLLPKGMCAVQSAVESMKRSKAAVVFAGRVRLWACLGDAPLFRANMKMYVLRQRGVSAARRHVRGEVCAGREAVWIA